MEAPVVDKFREARLKIERANKHIDDFSSQTASFLGADEGAHTVAIKTDAETGHQFVEIAAVQSLPDHFALILGDALHNLRSALDYAWCGVTAMDRPRKDKYRTRFPVYPDRAGLEAFIAKRSDQTSVGVVADRLLNVIQPYYGGQGAALYQLHQLDIADKQRLLTPQVQINEITGFEVENEKGERFSTRKKEQLKLPITLRTPQSRNLKLISNGNSTATIVFGKGTPGLVVLPTLRAFDAAVNRVLTILS